MKIHEKDFGAFLSNEKIEARIDEIAAEIESKYKGKRPLFVGLLNGAFMFASEIFKRITIDCEISFVKVASYEGMNSSGDVKKMIGLNANVFNRDVILVEDIVDTGLTLENILKEFEELGTASLEVATLLSKPDAHKTKLNLKYVGFEIPDEFVVGFGMDYDGLGRNLKDIYKIK